MKNEKANDNYELQVDLSRQIFLEYDQNLLIQKFQLQADEQWIYLEYMNTPCRISRKTGQVDELHDDLWEECRFYNTVMTIYDLLCYHRGPHTPTLSHQWCTVGNFVITGIQDTGTFTKKYAALFDQHPDALKAACLKLGGIMEKRLASADVTCRIPVTTFFPILLQFWAGDDEFPPKLQIMWDKKTSDFLHFETTFFLQGDLFKRLSDLMQISFTEQ